jgi:hypothetical protein
MTGRGMQMSTAAVIDNETIQNAPSTRLLQENPNWLDFLLSYVEYDCGNCMKYVNVFRYYFLGQYVRALRIIKDGVIADPTVVYVLASGIDALKQFIDNEDPERMRSSIAAGKELQIQIESALATIFKLSNNSTIVPAFDKSIEDKVDRLMRRFDLMLGKEMADLPMFCVEEKGSYSLRSLVKGCAQYQPPNVKSKITSGIEEEINEAGKCLAFSRATASAFHILRAVELLVTELITKTGLPMPPPNRCNWGEYISVLRTGGAPKEVTDLFQILKDNYRNPIMHPDDSLNLIEATSLFGICQSMIEVICRHIP